MRRGLVPREPPPFPVELTPEAKKRGEEDREEIGIAPIRPAFFDQENGVVHIEGDEKLYLPIEACPSCHGTGSFRGCSVPYGSTNVSLPDEPCETCWGAGVNPAAISYALRAAFAEGANWSQYHKDFDDKELNAALDEQYPDPNRPKEIA